MTQILKRQIMLKFWNMSDREIKKKVQVVVIAENSLLLFEFNNQIPNNYVGFQNITGAVEGDESYIAAAERELSEEAGLNEQVIDLNLQYEFFDRWKKQCIEKVFLCHLDKKLPITLNEEHLFYKWVPFSEVKESDYTFPSNYQAYLAAKKYIEEKK